MYVSMYKCMYYVGWKCQAIFFLGGSSIGSCFAKAIESTHDEYENTWKCGELNPFTTGNPFLGQNYWDLE